MLPLCLSFVISYYIVTTHDPVQWTEETTIPKKLWIRNWKQQNFESFNKNGTFSGCYKSSLNCLIKERFEKV